MEGDHRVVRIFARELLEDRHRLARFRAIAHRPCDRLRYMLSGRSRIQRLECSIPRRLALQVKIPVGLTNSRRGFCDGFGNADARAEILVGALEPCRRVNGIADRGIVEEALSAEIADDRRPTNGRRRGSCRAECRASDVGPELFRKAVDGKHQPHRAFGLVGLVDRRAEETDDGIANQLVEGCAMFDEQVAHGVEIIVEKPRERSGGSDFDSVVKPSRSVKTQVTWRFSPPRRRLDGSARMSRTTSGLTYWKTRSAETAARPNRAASRGSRRACRRWQSPASARRPAPAPPNWQRRAPPPTPSRSASQS